MSLSHRYCTDLFFIGRDLTTRNVFEKCRTCTSTDLPMETKTKREDLHLGISRDRQRVTKALGQHRDITVANGDNFMRALFLGVLLNKIYLMTARGLLAESLMNEGDS